MSQTVFETWHLDLQELLGLAVPPVAIAFVDHVPTAIDRVTRAMPPPTTDGRTGAVAASCVFWIAGTQSVFSTVAEDHGNCSVGSLTHGFKTIEEISTNSDVAALLDSGWVTMDVVPQIPTVSEKPGAVVYGPLGDTSVDPDVVLLRLSGKQLMVLHDAIPNLRIEGKPQCHIVAIAKEHGEPAASVGCALSRVRTGMSAHEMTCAIPASRLADVVATIQRNASA